jgi:membrane protein involved in colicin uptake
MHPAIGIAVVAAGLPLLGGCEQRQPAPPLVATSSPPPATTPAGSASAGQSMSAAELDRVRNHLASCWYLDPHEKASAVSIEVKLLPDGTVESTRVVDADRMATDQGLRAAAKAAQRAVLKCSPLPLPRDKYEVWKSTVFRFDSSGVVG